MIHIGSVLNKTTKAFIEFNPIEVSLQREKKVEVAGGGWKTLAERTLPPQRCRLVYRQNLNDNQRRTLPDGRVVVQEARLVFPLGADVQAGDTFSVDGETWEVSRVTNVLCVDAEVFRHGS